jgi:hypothetical protein
MSYCGRDEEAWISAFHWNRLVNLWRVGGPRGTSALAPRALRATRPGLRVIAALSSDGSRPYLVAVPVTAAPSASDPAGTITVTAYDGAGGVLATVRTASEADGGVIDVVLPVTDPARLELTPDGATTTTVLRSANAPTVTLAKPRTARVGRTTALPVTWTMTDADGDVLDATVEFSADGGRTWQTVAGAGPATSILLPAGSLRGTDDGRLRVTVSDGLRRTSAISGRIRVVGRPPKVALLTRGTLRAARNAIVRLSGYAVDEGGDSLARRQLRWLLGTRLLGRGETATVRFTTRGARTIRLVATDRSGRATTKTVRIVVR